MHDMQVSDPLRSYVFFAPFARLLRKRFEHLQYCLNDRHRPTQLEIETMDTNERRESRSRCKACSPQARRLY